MVAMRDWEREEELEQLAAWQRRIDFFRYWVDCIKVGFHLELKLRDLRRQARAMEDRQRIAALERALFNPAQPRVPAGNPDGGEWTSGDDSGEDDRTPRAILVGDGRGLPVNLMEEEAKGGHTIERHVAKPEEYLKARLLGNRVNIPYIGTAGTKQASSFTSLAAANSLVNATISFNKAKIEAWLSGSWAFPPFVGISLTTPSGYFGRPTGYAAYVRNDTSAPIMIDTDSIEVRLISDSKSPRGYRVLTAYPIVHEKE